MILAGDIPIYRLLIDSAPLGDGRGAEKYARTRSPYLKITFKFAGETWNLWTKLPDDRRVLSSGLIPTEWTYCEPCFASNRKSLQPDDFRKVKELVDLLRIHSFARIWGGEYKVERYQGMYANGGGGISQVTFADPLQRDHWFDDHALKANYGLAAALKGRNTAIARLEGFNRKKQGSVAVNRAYEHFFAKVYEPLTFEAVRSELGCQNIYYTYVKGTNFDRLLSDNQDYIDCARRAASEIDWAGLREIWPELVAREQELWREAYGIERQKMKSPDSMMSQIESTIDDAIDASDYAREQLGRAREAAAERERQRQALRNLYLNLQAANIQGQQQVRDSQVVVTGDGRVSNVGTERRRALAAGRRALEENRRITGDSGRRSGGGSSRDGGSTTGSSSDGGASGSGGSSSGNGSATAGGGSATAGGGSSGGGASAGGSSSGGGANGGGTAAGGSGGGSGFTLSASKPSCNLGKRPDGSCRTLADEEAEDRARQAREEAERQARKANQERLNALLAEERRRKVEERCRPANAPDDGKVHVCRR